jgi:hypothetical protein
MRRGLCLKDNEAMTGIQFVTDEKGRKVAVQIDLKKHRDLWQDIEDVLVSRSRRHEKRIPIEKVKEGLIKSGKLPRE